MSTIDFNFPYDFSKVYDANILEGTIKNVDLSTKKCTIEINGHLYNNVEIPYNPHTWIQNMVTVEGAFFLHENDFVYVLNAGGRIDFEANDLKIIGFKEQINSYAYTFEIVVYDEAGASISYNGQNTDTLTLIFKDGNGNRIYPSFIKTEIQSDPVSENEPYNIIEENPSDLVASNHIFFGLAGSLRERLKNNNGMTLQTISNIYGIDYTFTVDDINFTEYCLINHFFFHSPVNLVTTDYNTNKIYIHSALSGTISNSFNAPSWIDHMTGLATDGVDLYTSGIVGITLPPPGGNQWFGRIYHHYKFTSTILDSFSGPGNTLNSFTGKYDCFIIGLGNTNDSLLSSDLYSNRIYKHSGFTSSIFSAINPGVYIPSGSAFNQGLGWIDDSSDLISSNYSKDFIYHHSGFSTSIVDSFSSPYIYPAGLLFYNDEEDMFSIDRQAHRIYRHDGFSQTILDVLISPDLNPTGITIKT